MIFIMLCFALGLPLISYFFDKRDLKLFQEPLKTSQRQLLEILSTISNKPFNYWAAKNEEVLCLSLRSKQLFSHLFNQMHPIASIFGKYDPETNRMSRFSLYFTQLSIFSIISVASFGPTYRENDLLKT